MVQRIKNSIRRRWNAAKMRVMEWVENTFGAYITFHFRPKYASDFNLLPDKLKVYPKVAILIQGPLLKKDRFTLNTIRIYKKIFSPYKIILSTWEDEDKDYIKETREEGIEIILNKKPEFPEELLIPIVRFNYQIFSTFSALEKAKQMGCEYALKTRTDLRMYAPNSIEFLVNLVNVFSIKPEYRHKQKKRIAIAGINTPKYRPYSVSDMILFGDTDDMINYWSPGYDVREGSMTKNQPTRERLLGEWSMARLYEAYLACNFLEKMGRTLKFTIEDSWQMYADHFCVFDHQSLDLYFNKYARHNEYRWLEYKSTKILQEMTFREWLNIYAGLSNKKDIPEFILDKKLGDELKR